MVSSELLGHIPKTIEILGTLGFLMSFSSNQRLWIINRDSNMCQAPFPHECEPDYLHVHHVTPQHYSKEVFPMLDPDVPENGITLCREAHVGENGVHPDTFRALQIYHKGNKDAFNAMIEARGELLEQNQIYWNDQWDRIFHAIALSHTQNYEKVAGPFPTKKK